MFSWDEEKRKKKSKKKKLAESGLVLRSSCYLYICTVVIREASLPSSWTLASQVARA